MKLSVPPQGHRSRIERPIRAAGPQLIGKPLSRPMRSPIHHMTVIRYYRDGRPCDSERVESPSWSDVVSAIRRMDNYCFPIVQLNVTDNDEDESIFNIIGGAGRWALFHMMGEWQYDNPAGEAGDDDEVRLWDSDQGYFCKARNILTDVERVLRITKAYYDEGSYGRLDSIE